MSCSPRSIRRLFRFPKAVLQKSVSFVISPSSTKCSAAEMQYSEQTAAFLMRYEIFIRTPAAAGFQCKSHTRSQFVKMESKE